MSSITCIACGKVDPDGINVSEKWIFLDSCPSGDEWVCRACFQESEDRVRKIEEEIRAERGSHE